MKWLASMLVALASVAHAEDKGWNGLYGDLGVGGGSSHSTWATDAMLARLDEHVDQKARGGFLGGQIGYRWGRSFLFGMELAWYGGKMEERGDATLDATHPNRERITKVKDPGSLALQLGFGGSGTLLYTRV